MLGRPFCTENEAIAKGFRGPECARRRAVLRETVAAFKAAPTPDHYQRLAQSNLERWRAGREKLHSIPRIEVLAGDWGEVTQQVTLEYGMCFAVLNMANAYVPGGAYIEGAPAQEENMYRRTDCHFYISDCDYSRESDRYLPHMTSLLSGKEGRVYLDTAKPRVCIRDKEDGSKEDLGYDWLPEDQIFPFYELRASAQDLRGGISYDPVDSRRRIASQLDTLIHKKMRHAVLGAFGCGAFLNPANMVAEIYREEIHQRIGSFDCIVFAIYKAGYGPNNYLPFCKVFNH